MPHTQKSISITDRSSVGEARRAASASASALGFSAERTSDIGIVVTEAATNICSHAGSGEVLICPATRGDGPALDILALDSGPGIRDVGRAFEDGYSTAGTAGQGLGAIRRIADEMSLYSSPKNGTALLAHFGPTEVQRVGIVSIPVQGETKCGDAFWVEPGAQRSLYMVVDGLGHGTGANEAAIEARTTVQQMSTAPLTEIVTATHDALKKTRGAAMSIAAVDHAKQTVTYAGVGNISASILNGKLARSMVSQNGTLGAVLPTLQEFTYPFDRDSLLLMFSDGLNSRCNVGGYPGIRNRPLALIAGMLYRDFSRKRDDATVLLANLGGAS